MHRYPFNIPDDMMDKLRDLAKLKETTVRSLLLDGGNYILRKFKSVIKGNK